jgi:hypothetical protein
MSKPIPSGFPAGTLEDFSARMARVETDVSWLKRESATKTDLAELRADMFAMGTRLIKWMVGTVLTGAGVTAAVTAAALKLVG